MRVSKYFFLNESQVRLTSILGVIRSLARPGISIIVRVFAGKIKNITLRLLVDLMP